MGESWAWLILCLTIVVYGYSILIPAKQCVDSGVNLGWAAPKGALPDVTLPVLCLKLGAGQSMLLISERIAKAESPTGELFGFNRACALIAQSAQRIARAAQARGQEDDITVLTLTFSPAEVAHA